MDMNYKKIIESENIPLDIIELFNNVLGEKVKEFILPPPSFELMKCEVVDFDTKKKLIVVRIPVLESWLNPYATMQGGLIIGAIDNAVGPLSMLIGSKNVTRNIESKLLKPITMDVKYIFVTASLFEHKKRRLIFDAVVEDMEGNVYAKARLVNWIVE